jgi:thiamine monophosphate kinase
MKHLLMGVYQVCANKSPWVKIGPATLGWGVAYIQVSDLRAIMALLFFVLFLLSLSEHSENTSEVL